MLSPRFLTHERATDNSLAPGARVARATESTRASHALHTSLASIVVPAEGKVVHEEHDWRVLDECLNLDTAQAAEVVREVHVLQRAVIEVRATWHFNLCVVSLDVVAKLGIPR